MSADPNEAMLARARAEGGAEYRRGEAAATDLAGASFDLATAGQAFHWFDVPAALAELRRLFERHQRDGKVDFSCRCTAVLWRFAS